VKIWSAFVWLKIRYIVGKDETGICGFNKRRQIFSPVERLEAQKVRY
jgi:hypothetical protein